MKRYTVFYAGQLYIEFEYPIQFHVWRRNQVTEDREIYNGALIYESTKQEWWNMDMTPVLLNDVPKRLRVLALLLS